MISVLELGGICVVCGVSCPRVDHHFYEGLLERPKRQWIVRAPTYFLGTDVFCSPQCLNEKEARKSTEPAGLPMRSPCEATTPIEP